MGGTGTTWRTAAGCTLTVLLLVSVSGGVPVQSEEPEEEYGTQEETIVYPDVQMISEPLQLRVRQGADVILPCHIGGLDGQLVVLWKRLPTDILYTGKIDLHHDSRIRLVNSNDLAITGVQAEDAGTYVCSVSSYPVPLELKHNLTVLRPPRLHPLESDHFQVQEGDSFELVCRADGVPEPTITWSKVRFEDYQGHYFDDGDTLATTSLPEGADLVFLPADNTRSVAVSIDQARPEDTGTYTCTAQNGIGQPDVLSTKLEVLHAPHIVVEQSVVRTASGLTAELVCEVLANPRAKVEWTRNGGPVPNTSKYEKMASRKFFSLNIRDVQDSDLGNYTCHAQNAKGRSEHHLTLTGLPGPIDLTLGRAWSDDGVGFNVRIHWTVESYADIKEYTVSYRQVHPTETEWRRLAVQAARSRSVLQTAQRQLRELQDNATYELRLEAANRYGPAPPRQLRFSIDNGQLVQLEMPTLAESKTPNSAAVRRLQLIPVMLIISLSSFF